MRFCGRFATKKKISNRELKEIIVNMLQEHGINIKQAASDLDISVHRAHNWYYKKTGMTALDLFWIMRKYEFVRQAVENSMMIDFYEMPPAAKTSLPPVG